MGSCCRSWETPRYSRSRAPRAIERTTSRCPTWMAV
jgi:hypothetical protein